jgi:hypothetical protein
MQVPPSPQYAPDAKTMNSYAPDAKGINSPSLYSPSVPSMTDPVDSKDAKGQVNDPPAYDPPSYVPPVGRTAIARRRPHTNPVIEAGNIRARDEVGFTLSSV